MLAVAGQHQVVLIIGETQADLAAMQAGVVELGHPLQQRQGRLSDTRFWQLFKDSWGRRRGVLDQVHGRCSPVGEDDADS
ncbi:hypothetical protein AO265_23965 [Pseudomonas sp. ABAC61]|nr:hypothetical protein AO265_23965 [Pseudomonas sp. ABAC61]